MNSEYILQMEHIEKDFFGNKVLSDVSIQVRPGEIVALIGENGAGKSTLMNILFGMPSIHSTGGFKGRVLIGGEEVHIDSPVAAMHYGIGMVHQEFMLIDGYDVAENIKLNRENLKHSVLSKIFGSRMNFIDSEGMHKDAEKVLNDLQFDLKPTTRIGGMAVGAKQFVEIARELDKSNIRLIVLDEPTAVLTENESEQFLKCVRQVAQEKNIAFIFISHKLDEIKNITSTTYVLRDGALVGVYPTAQLTPVQMSELMVGRKVEIQRREVENVESTHKKICMELKHVRVHMPGEVTRDVNLQVYEGEILGIGGLAGQGKISIANGIMGLFPSFGEITFYGEPLNCADTAATLKKGFAFVSEDRRGTGLMLDESIEMNIVASSLAIKNGFLKKRLGIPFYDHKKAVEVSQQMIQQLDIRCTGYKQPVKSLSGGNQQKVCLARALVLEPKILLVSEPTRGIDIGAKKMILDTLLRMNKEQGITIIFTSSELAELRSVCDRIAIISEGKVAGILRNDDEDYKFGLLMSGSSLETT